VVLCDDHEVDFVYWFREAGGSAYRGDPELADAFHEWFAEGGRAPEDYGGIDHVETDPDALPDPPSPAELRRRLEESYEGERVDLREAAEAVVDPEERTTGDRIDDETLAEAGVDLDADYPTK
jgi:hypothetical protein